MSESDKIFIEGTKDLEFSMALASLGDGNVALNFTRRRLPLRNRPKEQSRQLHYRDSFHADHLYITSYLSNSSAPLHVPISQRIEIGPQEGSKR